MMISSGCCQLGDGPLNAKRLLDNELSNPQTVTRRSALYAPVLRAPVGAFVLGLSMSLCACGHLGSPCLAPEPGGILGQVRGPDVEQVSDALHAGLYGMPETLYNEQNTTLS